MFISYFIRLDGFLENHYYDEDIKDIYIRELEPLVADFLTFIEISAIRSRRFSEENVDCIVEIMEDIITRMKTIENYLP